MKKLLFVLLLIINISVFAQRPNGKEFGFGIILGDPTGLTVKYWNSNSTAFVFDLGASYFGSPRIGVDYLWHFDAFNSDVVKLYAGPGMVLGIGEGRGIFLKNKKDGIWWRDDGDFGLGVRGVFGVNVVPRRTPIELFFELGVLIAMAPEFGSAVDGALGIRFYP